jgi:hypothetical protein
MPSLLMKRLTSGEELAEAVRKTMAVVAKDEDHSGKEKA